MKRVGDNMEIIGENFGPDAMQLLREQRLESFHGKRSGVWSGFPIDQRKLATPAGLEPATSRLEISRSIQLS